MGQSVEVADLKLNINEGDRGEAVVSILIPSGALLRVYVDKDGRVRLDHGKILDPGKPVEDLRTILTGSLRYTKRTFDVYSTSGYTNHYRGKPVDPTAAATAAAPSQSNAGASAGTSSPVTDSGVPATSTPTPAKPAADGGAKVSKADDVKPGDAVKRGKETGVVVGVNEDTVGKFVEVEWTDAGYESIYEIDLGKQSITTVDPTKKASASSSRKKGAKPEKATLTVRPQPGESALDFVLREMGVTTDGQ